MLDRHLDSLPTLAGQGRPEQGHEFADPFRREQDRQVMPDHLRRRPAGELLKRAVETRDPEQRVPHDDRRVGGIEQVVEEGAGFAQALLGQLALVDVDVRADDARQFPVGVETGAAAGLDPFVAAVLAAEAVLRLVERFPAGQVLGDGQTSDLDVVGMDHGDPFIHVLRDIVGLVAQDFLAAIRVERRAGDEVVFPDAGRTALHGAAPAFLILAHRLVGRPQVLDETEEGLPRAGGLGQQPRALRLGLGHPPLGHPPFGNVVDDDVG